MRRYAARLRALLGAALLALVHFGACAETAPVVLVFGDSLSAGYGLSRGQGWVDLLQDKLKRGGLGYVVVNASVSGETTAGGRSRIEAALERFHPAVVVLELGANDGLRGQALVPMRENLEFMVDRIQKRGARALLVGIRLPSNYGPRYTAQFYDTFREVAREYKSGYVPFLFEGLQDNDENFQGDRLHPSALAQPKLLDNVWTGLRPLLQSRDRP